MYRTELERNIGIVRRKAVKVDSKLQHGTNGGFLRCNKEHKKSEVVRVAGLSWE